MSFSSKNITNASAITLVDINATGLVSAYDFRNGSLTDLKGSNNGTQYGTLDFVRDRWGTGVRGDEQGAINLGTGFGSQTDFFCSLWYLHQTPGAGGRFIANQRVNSSDEWGLDISSNSLLIYDNIDAAGTVRYTTTLIPGNMYHIVFGINSSKVNKMWVNGVASDNDEVSSSLFSTLSGGVLHLMQRYTGAQLIKGEISNLEIYNTDLTDADVSAIYNRGKNIKSFFDRGLIASGKTFSSGFVENSQISTDDLISISVESVNGHLSKVLSTDSSIPATLVANTLSFSTFNINPKQASYGTWQFYYNQGSSNNSALHICANGVANASAAANSNYNILLLGSSGSATLRRMTTSVITGGSVTLGTWNSFRVTRDYSGLFKLYINGNLIGSATDTTYTGIGYYINLVMGDAKIILNSENPDYNFWYSPNVIEP